VKKGGMGRGKLSFSSLALGKAALRLLLQKGEKKKKGEWKEIYILFMLKLGRCEGSNIVALGGLTLVT